MLHCLHLVMHTVYNISSHRALLFPDKNDAAKISSCDDTADAKMSNRLTIL